MADQIFREVLVGQIQYYEGRMNAFKERLDKDAAHAFEWASDDIRAAAKLDVCRIVIGQLDGGDELGTILEEARDQIHRRARSKPESTSPISNLTNDYRLEAWVTLWEVIRENIKRAKGGGQ